MTDLVPVAEVLALGGGRWKSAGTLAAASRAGSGPGGRVVLTANRAAYRRDAVERFFAEDSARREATLSKLRANAAKARAARAARRGPK